MPGSTRSLERILIALPAGIAVGLAVIYVLGALSIAAQMNGEGLDEPNGVGLHSLEQILVQGVALLAQRETLLAGLFLLVVGAWAYEQARARSRGPTSIRQQARARQALGWRLWGPVALTAVLTLAISPRDTPAVLPMLATLVGVGVIERREPGSLTKHPRTFIAWLVATLLATMVLLAFTGPRPLMEADLTLLNGGSVSGSLVAQGSGTWFIREGEEGDQIIALPERQVMEVELVQPEAEDPRTGVSYARDFFEDVF